MNEDPISFEDLMKTISGYWQEIKEEYVADVYAVRNDMDVLYSCIDTHVKEIKQNTGLQKDSLVKYRRRVSLDHGFNGNPTSNLIQFLTTFNLKWDDIDSAKREKTIKNLQLLYDCINNPFKYDEILGKGKRSSHVKMIEELKKLELTKDLAYVINQLILESTREMKDG